MAKRTMTRRDVALGASLGLAATQLFELGLFAQVWTESEGETVVPFLDQPPDPPTEELERLNGTDWDSLSEWLSDTETFFKVSHYDQPEIDPDAYRLEISGLVERPLSLSLSELQARPKQEVVFTLECAGNHGFPWFVGGLGNAKWAGTRLAPLLESAGIRDEGIEVVFFGRDAGEEEFARQTVPQNFARSMSVEDALAPDNILCYEMNGGPLPRAHGFPIRLIAPGWYGVANVKWLDRIEVWSTRYAGRFMARDYVTVREEEGPSGSSVYTQKVVGRTLLKSALARVTRKDDRLRIHGAAWGGEIERVEIQIDDSAWRSAVIDEGANQPFAWKFWHFDASDLGPGEHSITARAVDRRGKVQPTAEDPIVAKRLTYWENNGQQTRRIRL